jgi:hypothetical protein
MYIYIYIHMSIRSYNSIAGNSNVSNYFDIYDENLNKIRFSIKNEHLYITSYNTNSGEWSPANVIFDNSPIQTTSIIDYQDILNSNNIRIQLDANLDANGSELLVFEKDNNYNYIKRSGINYDIISSPYLPTTNLDDRIVIYTLDSSGKPKFTLSSLSTNNLTSNFMTLSDAQTIIGAKTFNYNKLLLKGVGGNITLNGSQTASSSAYTLEFPTAAPTGELNVLTTSGSSPYSKLIWTDLATYSSGSGSGSSYMTLSGTNSNSAANTWSGVNTFNVDKLVLSGNGGNLNLNASQTALSAAYSLEYPAAAPVGIMNVLTTSGSSPYSKYTWTDLSSYLTSATAVSTYMALSGTNSNSAANTWSGVNTFNSDCMKVNNIFALGSALTVKNSSATFFDVTFNSKFTNSQPGWITIDPTNLSTSSNGTAFYGDLCVQQNAEIMNILALSGTNTDTATSSGQKLTVLNTSTHAVERVNITPDNLATLSGTQTISGDKTFTGTVNLGTVNISGRMSASYAINTTTSFQTVTTLNSTGMYLMTASTNAADGTHGLYYVCMEESGLIVALSANNFAFQFVSGQTLQVRTVSQGFNNCEINILRLK